MAENITRSAFVKGMGLVPGAAAAASIMAGTAAADETEGRAWDYETDIVVVGSGAGGFTAAMTAMEAGVSDIVMVEIDNHTGGGSSFSDGGIHQSGAGLTIESFDEYTKYAMTDPISHKCQLQFEETLDWVASHEQFDLMHFQWTSIGRKGEEVENDSLALLDPDGNVSPYGTRPFFDAFEQMFKDAGGTLLMETAAEKILTDHDSGAIQGIRCSDVEGNKIYIKASQVILACGGFQNNKEMLAKYMGPYGENCTVMGTPYNSGIGIKMAEELGAKLAGHMGGWAGIYAAALPAKNPMESIEDYKGRDYSYETGRLHLFNTLIDEPSETGIIVNQEGLRYVDEFLVGHESQLPLAKQTNATGIAICDADGYEDWQGQVNYGTASSMGEKIQNALSEEIGGTLYVADSIEELADKLNGSCIIYHQVDKANLIKTVEEYNAAAEAGTSDMLTPPRTTGKIQPIVKPPFYALPIRPAIFGCFGGLAIDEYARVLDTNDNPIPGLYACMPTANSGMCAIYVGMIYHATVSGRWAGAAAAAALGHGELV